MSLTFLKLYDLSKDREKLLKQIQEWRLVPESCICSQCGEAMTLSKDNERQEKIHFHYIHVLSWGKSEMCTSVRICVPSSAVWVKCYISRSIFVGDWFTFQFCFLISGCEHYVWVGQCDFWKMSEQLEGQNLDS